MEDKADGGDAISNGAHNHTGTREMVGTKESVGQNITVAYASVFSGSLGSAELRLA